MMDYDYQSCTETLTSLISLEFLGCNKCVRLSPLGLVSRVIVKCGECNVVYVPQVQLGKIEG